MSRPEQVSLSDEAKHDLRKAYDWYESQQVGLGLRFTAAFVDAIDDTVERPPSFPVVARDIQRVILAKFPFGVFYRIAGDVIRVIGVIDLRSDDRAWMERIAKAEQ